MGLVIFLFTAIALGLHTTTLILVKGAVDARGSNSCTLSLNCIIVDIMLAVTVVTIVSAVKLHIQFRGLYTGLGRLARATVQVSLAHWNQDEAWGGFGGPHCMVKGGYSSLMDPVAATLDVRKDAAVSQIAYSNEGVKVTATSGVVQTAFCLFKQCAAMHDTQYQLSALHEMGRDSSSCFCRSTASRKELIPPLAYRSFSKAASLFSSTTCSSKSDAQ